MVCHVTAEGMSVCIVSEVEQQSLPTHDPLDASPSLCQVEQILTQCKACVYVNQLLSHCVNLMYIGSTMTKNETVCAGVLQQAMHDWLHLLRSPVISVLPTEGNSYVHTDLNVTTVSPIT